MEYQDAVDAMFQPSPGGAVSPPTVNASPARRLRDALEPIAMHSVWSRSVNERLAELSHDFMTGYVSCRASLLGEPTPGVVAASFAVFEPSLVAGAYEAGRAACDRETLVRTRQDATIESLSEVLDGADVAPAAAALRRGAEAASGEGRPLFSGLRDQPWPDSPVGDLWRAAELIREHRGDSHVAVCVSAGLDAVEMNVLTELFVGYPFATYSASRGWDETALHEALGRLAARRYADPTSKTLTEEGQAFRAEIEAATDAAQRQIVAAVGDDLDMVVATASDWSQRCIEVGAFPPDVFKRAAG